MNLLEEFNKEKMKTLTDLLGNVVKEEKFTVTTDKDVFVNLTKGDIESHEKDCVVHIWSEKKISDELSIFEVFLKPNSRQYSHEYGYLLTKNGKPHIFSTIPGDNYGATVFKGVFKVSGHDGSYMFDIDNPSNMQEDLR